MPARNVATGSKADRRNPGRAVRKDPPANKNGVGSRSVGSTRGSTQPASGPSNARLRPESLSPISGESGNRGVNRNRAASAARGGTPNSSQETIEEPPIP
eukprot:GHVU01058227.1.p2 GENE.GHVU01058227.1~~GHVU01058227.1.p2  ORF type:complete len:100 (+),score=6.64 GHVU01058227.1:252-551(+)